MQIFTARGDELRRGITEKQRTRNNNRSIVPNAFEVWTGAQKIHAVRITGLEGYMHHSMER